MTDKEIIEVYKKLKKELLIYIYRFTGSLDSSEDILHDCFINLINYTKNTEVKELRPFLYKTAHNLSINYINKNKRIESKPPDDYNKLVFHDNNEEELEYKELENNIQILINQLDNFDKSIFIMKKYLGMSTAEIAMNTGKSERTIRRKLKKITEYLITKLEISGLID